MRLIVLGSGTSFGVPVVGCTCEVCTSSDPRDRRTRVAAVVEGDEGKRILIDTPPELRIQLLGAQIPSVDAVLYTHDHADHVHGIDDLRALSVRRGQLPIYGPPDTLTRLAHHFPYIFDDRITAPAGTSIPQLMPRPLTPGAAVTIAGMQVLPLPLLHGELPVYGYRIGPVGYVTDAKSVSAPVVEQLRGVRILVLNALFERPHPTHLSIPEAIEVARQVGAERTFLTHLTHRSSHEALLARLPEGIEPAYDGLCMVL